MATPQDDHARTFLSALSAIAQALRDSDLIESADVTHTGSQRGRLAVQGHIDGHPDVRFVVQLDVS